MKLNLFYIIRIFDFIQILSQRFISNAICGTSESGIAIMKQVTCIRFKIPSENSSCFSIILIYMIHLSFMNVYAIVLS